MLTTRRLAIDLLRTLFRRRANALLLFLLFWLLIVVSCSLKVTGGSVVQGHAIPIDETARISLAIGSAFGGAHFIGLLVVIFVALPAVVGEVESGLASWVLVKNVSRGRYLVSRFIGAAVFVVAIVAIVLSGLEVLLARHIGAIQFGPIAGACVMAVLLVAYLAWGVLLAFVVGSGSAAIIVFLLSLASVVVHSDSLTRYFLAAGGSESAPSFVDAIVGTLLGGATPSPVLRVVYGALYFLTPATKNLHDLASALALGETLPLGIDYVTCAIAAASAPLALVFACRALDRKEIT
ncbi:MAG: hypothetical protein ACKVU1_13835 [bacterium]